MLAKLASVLVAPDNATESTGDFRNVPAGQLRIGIPPAAAEMLASVVARFATMFPEVKLEIAVDGLRSTIADFHRKENRPQSSSA